ncbi:MAG: Trk system potassium transporter TrkA [Gudongella sp.]|nr:Trk system potassium transporter TrkA [Gudongella sp.]
MKAMIVGAGKLGSKLAEFLIAENIDVTVMDSSNKVLERLNEHLDVLTVVANGIDIRMMRELGISEYDLLVGSTENDETNTLICTLAKKLGCKQTIARIRNPEYMQQIDFIKAELGIDHIVNPDLATAIAMEKYLMKSYSFYTDEFASGKVQMVDFNVGDNQEFVGMRIMDLKGLDSLLITAISREGNLIIPNGSTEILKGDIIHVIGKANEIEKISGRLGEDYKTKLIRSAMILGGGNVGYYLAQRLERNKIQVTLIEQDKKRCQDLSELLDNVLIIHGDGTDIHLLEEENLSSMDAFIGVTGFDEENLLMALMAKQSGVRKSIAKISRSNYIKIIDRLKIDAAINPVYITASSILKYIRGGKVVSVSLLLGGNAEVTEIIIDKDLPCVGKKLIDLAMPKGMIIGAIVRDNDVIIPKGNTELKANDRIVVFCLSENLAGLKMFFKPKKGGLFGELWNRNKSAGKPADS